MEKILTDKLKEIIVICKKHNIDSIAVFGSAAKNEMNENSDIDFLVKFSNKINVLDYADNYFSVLEKLEKLIGKKVDLVSVKSLINPVLISEINNSKIELYAA
jgi:predicted nucleotidyltransferase